MASVRFNSTSEYLSWYLFYWRNELETAGALQDKDDVLPVCYCRLTLITKPLGRQTFLTHASTEIGILENLSSALIANGKATTTYCSCSSQLSDDRFRDSPRAKSKYWDVAEMSLFFEHPKGRICEYYLY